MALSATSARTRERPGQVGSFLVNAAEIIYEQALVGTRGTTSGAAAVENWEGASNSMRFLGVARIRQTSQDDVGSSVTGVAVTDRVSLGTGTYIEVDMSGLVFEGVAIAGLDTWTEIGDLVFASDENTFTLSATQAKAVGFVVTIDPGTGGTGDVKLFTPGEYRCEPAV